MQAKAVMFDTNIFNRILDGKIDIDSLNRNFSYYVTHIQCDEICKTKDFVRKERLKAVFKKVPQSQVPTESAVIGISRVDECKISDGSFYKEIRSLLDSKKKDKNNCKNALIAEMPIKNGCILVTDDCALKETVIELGGKAVSSAEFKRMTNIVE